MSGKKKFLNFIDWADFLGRQRVDQIPLIDVRSQTEFLLGQVPGAISAPLLTDEHRHQVGLTYKTVSRQESVALGLELFAKRVEAFSHTIESSAKGHQSIGISCWRGGMRSQFSAMWANALGLRPLVLKGGYKAYRKLVLDAIEGLAKRRIYVLDGRTGSGKTDLLNSLPACVARIDLEGIAHHRGSAFGDFAQDAPSPTQQNFENILADQIWRLPADRPVIVEIENAIGPVRVPHALRQAMESAPVILVERDLDDRINRLVEVYVPYWSEANDKLFAERCQLLKKHLTAEQIAAIVQTVESREFKKAVRMLLEQRYDRIYDKGINRRKQNVIARFNLTTAEDRAKDFFENLK